MRSNFIKILVFSFIVISILAQCKTKDTAMSIDKSEMSPLVVRVLLIDGENGRHMEKTYKSAKPSGVKAISRSENWYRVVFNEPGNKAQIMAQLRSDKVILKVESDEDMGTDVEKSKSLKRSKTAPIR